MAVLAAAAGVPSALAQAKGLQDSESGQESSVAQRYTIVRFVGHRSCPGQERFREELDAALGPSPGAATPQSAGVMRITLGLRKRRGQYVLELITEDDEGGGTRELHAPRCAELVRTAALIVSLAMQPDLLYENESEREVEVTQSRGVQASDDEDPRRQLVASERRRLGRYREAATGSRLRISTSLAALTDIGTLPRAALGLGLIASAHSRRLRLSFRLTQWAEQRRYVSSFNEGRGGNFDYLSASLDLCGQLWSGPISTGACGIVGLGRLKGQSIVSDVPTAQTHIMANAGPGVYASLPIGRSSLRLQAELVVQFVRPNYSVEVLDPEDDTIVVTRQIHKVAPVAAHLAASWGISF